MSKENTKARMLYGYTFTKEKGSFAEKKDRGEIYYRYSPLYDELTVLVDSMDKIKECQEKCDKLKLKIKDKKAIVSYHEFRY